MDLPNMRLILNAVCGQSLQLGPHPLLRNIRRLLLLLLVSMSHLQANAAVLSIWRDDGASNNGHATVHIQDAHCLIDVTPQFTLLLDAASDTAYQTLHPAKC